MNDYQRGVLAGLQVGAPAAARMYQRIIEQPGISVAEANDYVIGHAAQRRTLLLERSNLITTRKENRRRAYYPVERP